MFRKASWQDKEDWIADTLAAHWFARLHSTNQSFVVAVVIFRRHCGLLYHILLNSIDYQLSEPTKMFSSICVMNGFFWFDHIKAVRRPKLHYYYGQTGSNTDELVNKIWMLILDCCTHTVHIHKNRRMLVESMLIIGKKEK